MLYFANISKPMVVPMVLMNSVSVSKKTASPLEILVGWCGVGSCGWLLCERTTKAILPVVLYGCETWSLTLREERKLSVFENLVLRRIFGPRRDEVTGEWRRLRNEELNDLYCTPHPILCG